VSEVIQVDGITVSYEQRGSGPDVVADRADIFATLIGDFGRRSLRGGAK
jgi:hypothetical protein